MAKSLLKMEQYDMIRNLYHSHLNLAAATTTESKDRKPYSKCKSRNYCISYALELCVNSSCLYFSSRSDCKLGSLKDVEIYYTTREKKPDHR